MASTRSVTGLGRLAYNHYTIAHVYNAANAHAKGSEPKSYSLVEGNLSIILNLFHYLTPWRCTPVAWNTACASVGGTLRVKCSYCDRSRGVKGHRQKTLWNQGKMSKIGWKEKKKFKFWHKKIFKKEELAHPCRSAAYAVPAAYPQQFLQLQ